MSHYRAQQLYALLPAIYRLRDANQGYVLRDLIDLIAEQAVVLERDILQLYENWFIETCDDWVVPYLGDLIGVRRTHPTRFSRRAEVANTIGYRRPKGTAAVLEQLARDSTGWPARVVEFFELLATTQHVNHVRPHTYRTPDLRRVTALEHLNGPFDTAAHTAEVRAISNRRGRYNIPNVGLFLWRLTAYPLAGVTPHEVDDGTGLHYTFSVLGNDTPLFNHPRTETSPAHIAEEINVPAPIRRRALLENPAAYYGTSILIEKDGEAITSQNIVACDLTDWAPEPPPGKVAIDPEQGLLAFPSDELPPSGVRVHSYYGFSADIGGGSYERATSFSDEDLALFRVGAAGTFSTIGVALEAWQGQGSPRAVIEIGDSATYEETLVFNIPTEGRLVICAANRQRPTLLLAEDEALQITGGAGSSVELNGLLIAGALRIDGVLDGLQLQHCTLVPGLGLSSAGEPLHPARPSLIVASPQAEVTVNRCILGAIRAHVDAAVELHDSILDANNRTSAAYEALEGVQKQGGGRLKISRCTVIGTIHTRVVSLGEHSIFLGQVVADQRQTGCVRFSYVALGSRVPRRYHCQPLIPAEASSEEAERIAARVPPRFTSLRYGDPGYCQLTRSCPEAIRRGAEDESEMGVFSSQQQPQREDNLLIRLEEYLRFGLAAGIFRVMSPGTPSNQKSTTAVSVCSRVACNSTLTGMNSMIFGPTAAAPRARTSSVLGAPRTGGGFEISAIGEEGNPDLVISPGRIYVDGILCELEATPVHIEAVEGSLSQVTVPTLTVDGRQFEAGQWVEIFADDGGVETLRTRITSVGPGAGRMTLQSEVGDFLQEATAPRLRRLATFFKQPDYLPALDGVESLARLADGVYLVYLDVWERHISALEDPEIREKALGGPDTATRTQVIWQVKLFAVPESEAQPVTCREALLRLQTANQSSGSLLRSRAQPSKEPTGPCVVPPGAGFIGLENHLYRVEIHEGGALDQATFKWSRIMLRSRPPSKNS